MNAKPRDARTHADPAAQDKPDAKRDADRDRRRDRMWRIGATQLAAPSTRRWRRAGTFGPSR